MGAGYLTIQALTGDDALPVANAHVIIKRPDGVALYETDTDANGNTGRYSLTAPDMKYTLDPYLLKPAYSVCDVDVIATGFVTEHIHSVEIVDTQTTILPVDMHPLVDEPNPTTNNVIVIPPVALLIPAENRQVGPPGERISLPGRIPFDDPPDDPPEARALTEVIIPDYITIHLGQPTNASARNVRVRFADYIKNVVSSEIYSTWPYNSLVANTHAIVTFALNRVYTEWYRSRGFNFDITNSTSYDQFYREGGPIFENISRIVDGVFNVYARRFGFRNPFFTQFCNGTTVTCPGLSQWGTVTLEHPKSKTTNEPPNLFTLYSLSRINSRSHFRFTIFISLQKFFHLQSSPWKNPYINQNDLYYLQYVLLALLALEIRLCRA